MEEFLRRARASRAQRTDAPSVDREPSPPASSTSLEGPSCAAPPKRIRTKMCLTVPSSPARQNRNSAVKRYLRDAKHPLQEPDPESGQLRTLVPTLLFQDGWNGGKAVIPDSEYPLFLAHYANDVVSGVTHFISEQRSPTFRMHVDLDFLLPHGSCHDAFLTSMVAYGILIQSETKKFFRRAPSPQEDDWSAGDSEEDATATPVSCATPSPAAPNFDMILLVRPPSEVKKAGSNYTKMGMHLVFPNIVADIHQALMYREAYLLALRSAYGEREECNPWSDVVDFQIYTRNGLRMAYSNKLDRCPECAASGRCGKNRGGDRSVHDCSLCPRHHPGRVDIGAPYTPLLYISADGDMDEALTDKLKQNVHFCVNSTSIRRAKGTPTSAGWMAVPGGPIYDLKSLDKSFLRKSRGAKEGGCSQSSSYATGSKYLPLPSKRVDIDSRDGRWSAMLELIRAQKPYCEVSIRDMYCNPSRSYYVARLDGPGSRYCQNLRDHHQTRTVYFYLTKRDGLVQKCSCRCDSTSGRLYGRCKDYSSSPKRIRSCITEDLFFGGTRKRGGSRLVDLGRNGNPEGVAASEEFLNNIRRARYGDLVCLQGQAQRDRSGLRRPQGECLPVIRTEAPAPQNSRNVPSISSFMVSRKDRASVEVVKKKDGRGTRRVNCKVVPTSMDIAGEESNDVPEAIAT